MATSGAMLGDNLGFWVGREGNVQGNPATPNQECEAQGRKMPPVGG